MKNLTLNCGHRLAIHRYRKDDCGFTLLVEGDNEELWWMIADEGEFSVWPVTTPHEVVEFYNDVQRKQYAEQAKRHRAKFEKKRVEQAKLKEILSLMPPVRQ